MVEERLSDEQYFAARAAALKERAEQGHPESWKPTVPGDTVIGVLVGKSRAHAGQYGERDIAILEHPVAKERISVWLLGEVLINAFKRENPQMGELVCIVYKGKAQPKGAGNEYHDWSVTVDRPIESAGPVDWGGGADEQARAGRRETDPVVGPVGVPAESNGNTQSAQGTVWGGGSAAPGADYAGADDDIPFAPTSYDSFV